MENQAAYNLKAIQFGGEIDTTLQEFTPEPVPAQIFHREGVWEYYLNREGKVFIRDNNGRKATFNLKAEELNKFKGEYKQGAKLSFRFQSKR